MLDFNFQLEKQHSKERHRVKQIAKNAAKLAYTAAVSVKLKYAFMKFSSVIPVVDSEVYFLLPKFI